MLPRILFVDDFAERSKIAMICCLAWNIALFPEARERTRYINKVWAMTEADNPGPPPPGLENGFKADMHQLVEQKLDLFPRLHVNISGAELLPARGYDLLVVTTPSSREEIKLVSHPNILGLPHIIEFLEGIQRDTARQVDLIAEAKATQGALDDLMLTQMERVYAVQRAGLVGYHSILRHWWNSESAADTRAVISYWLLALDGIERDSKAILKTLQD